MVYLSSEWVAVILLKDDPLNLPGILQVNVDYIGHHFWNHSGSDFPENLI